MGVLGYIHSALFLKTVYWYGEGGVKERTYVAWLSLVAGLQWGPMYVLAHRLTASEHTPGFWGHFSVLIDCNAKHVDRWHTTRALTHGTNVNGPLRIY